MKQDITNEVWEKDSGIRIREIAKSNELGQIVQAIGPWNKVISSFRKRGYEVMSGRDLAYARLALGPEHVVSTSSSSIKSALITLPENEFILVRESPLLGERNAEYITERFLNPEQYSLIERLRYKLTSPVVPNNSYLGRSLELTNASKKYVEMVSTIADEDCAKDPEKKRALRFTFNNEARNIKIPVDRFKDNEKWRFILQDLAESYIDLLKHITTIKQTGIEVGTSELAKRFGPLIYQQTISYLSLFDSFPYSEIETQPTYKRDWPVFGMKRSTAQAPLNVVSVADMIESYKQRRIDFDKKKQSRGYKKAYHGGIDETKKKIIKVENDSVVSIHKNARKRIENLENSVIIGMFISGEL